MDGFQVQNNQQLGGMNSQKQERKASPTLDIPKASASKDPEVLKILKKPRTKKFMKALKMADILSANDERLIEEIKKDKGVSPDSDIMITEEDMELFRKKVQDTIAEEYRREEEIRTRIRNTFLGTISTCAIPGCVVHGYNPKTGEITEHYNYNSAAAISKDMKTATDMILSIDDWNYVEIYGGYLIQRNANGDVIKTVEREDE